MSRKSGVTTRRSASLKQTRTAQTSLEIPQNGITQAAGVAAAGVPSSSSPPSIANNYSTASASSRKSNWEVIEHFNSGAKSRGSVSSSLIAVWKLLNLSKTCQ